METRTARSTSTAVATLLIVGAVQFAGCKGRLPEHKKIMLVAVASPLDSTIKGFYDNKYYMPNIVRLPHSTFGRAFIYVDSPGSMPRDNRLLPAEREVFYTNALGKVAATDKDAYYKAWSLPEIQKLQQADGGYGTVFLTITSRPVKDTPLYIIEIRRNNVKEFPLHSSLAFVKFDERTHETWMADNTGYYVPLSAIRAIH
jgi:hypothetical protein